MTSHDQWVRVCADGVLRYLDEHPQAADTARGIQEWWVIQQVFSQSAETVQDALDSLVAQGLVRRIDRPGMPAVYQRARRDP